MAPLRYITLCLAITSLAHGADAVSPVLTLKTAIQEAVANSLEKQAAEAKRAALSSRSRGALAPSEPEISVSFGALGLGSSEATRPSYALSQAFAFPGKAYRAAEGIRSEAAAAEADAKAAEEQAAASVTHAYSRLWLVRRNLQSSLAARQEYERIQAIAKRRSVKDTTTEVDYLDVQLAISRIDAQRSDFAAEEGSALAGLNLWLGRDAGGAVQLEDLERLVESNGTPVPASLEQILTGKNAALRAAQMRQEAAETRLAAARMAWLPDISLQAGLAGDGTGGAAAGLTLPLWGYWNENVEAQAARQDAAVEAARVKALGRSLLAALGEKENTLASLASKLQEFRLRTLPLSQRAFQVALSNYRYGKIDFTTLTAAAESSYSSQAAFNALVADFAGTRADLEALLGGPLP